MLTVYIFSKRLPCCLRVVVFEPGLSYLLVSGGFSIEPDWLRETSSRWGAVDLTQFECFVPVGRLTAQSRSEPGQVRAVQTTDEKRAHQKAHLGDGSGGEDIILRLVIVELKVGLAFARIATSKQDGTYEADS